MRMWLHMYLGVVYYPLHVRVSAHGCSGVALEAGAWPSAGAHPVRVSGGVGGWRKRKEDVLMCLVCVLSQVRDAGGGGGVMGVDTQVGSTFSFIPF